MGKCKHLPILLKNIKLYRRPYCCEPINEEYILKTLRKPCFFKKKKNNNFI